MRGVSFFVYGEPDHETSSEYEEYDTVGYMSVVLLIAIVEQRLTI